LNCKYRGYHRYSDLTIADFLGGWEDYKEKVPKRNFISLRKL